MKGVVYLGESEVEVREFDQPEPGPGQVVIESKIGGLCGSDLHKYHSSREWASEREGMISGHEPTGVVAEVGQGVTNVKVGDRVTVYHRTGCGHCPDCYSGMPAHCQIAGGAFGRTQDGSHADFMLSEARYCLPLPDAISFEVGTQLACTAGTSFSAISKVSAHAGEPVLVFGLGPVGLTAYLYALGMGYDAIGVDIHPYRIDLANRIGSGTVIDASTDDPVSAVNDLTKGKGVRGVVECSGSDAARSQAGSVAGRGATLVYVGSGKPEFSANVGWLIGKGITIKGNSVYSYTDYYAAVEFLQTHDIPLDDIVTHRFKIEDAVEAFNTFDAGDTGKVVFEW
jgi:threonine dehydrogenase-like Zn-dependent dehydrogenase